MNRTADEARADALRAMGQELGDLYSALWQEVAWLHAKWEEHVVLFGTKESRVELLNRASPQFARIVQDTTWEDVLLHIARLTDPPKSAGKENLTIQSLAPLVSDPVTRTKVTELVDAANVATEFCRDWRNRHLAHRDLRLALNRGAQSLKEASRLGVRTALRSIVDALNAISARYLDSTSMFEVGPGPGGALNLLHVIDDGLITAEERQSRLTSGCFEPRDLAHRDL
jgi:AbiU2